MTTTEPRILRPYQQEAVDAVLHSWGTECRSTAVVLPTGTGKPLHNDTPIPTPGGFARMGSLRVGNYVFGVDGKPVRVTAVQPQGVIELFRVRFDDGSELIAGPDHLWTVQRKGRKPRTVTTEWLRAQPIKDRDGYCWRVPVAAPVQYMSRSLPADPYLVGSLIANGDMTHGVPILITPDVRVVDEIASRGVDVKPAYALPGACPRWSFPGMSHALTRSGIRYIASADKYIPEPFKVADEHARWDLLRGLMDGDGSTRAGGRRSVDYHTTSRVLADDVAEVAWSLGVRASISMADRSRENKGIEYAVHLLPPAGVSLFTSHRRDRAEHPRRTFVPRRSIAGIDYAGVGPATCITVDSDDGLFAAGRRYVVTHNSTVIAAVAAASARLGLRVVLLAHRAELLDQMAASVAVVDPALAPVGIVRASRDDSTADIVAASLQTLTNRHRLHAIGRRDVILWDECFVAGTPVDGRPIESLQVGDTVTAWSELGHTTRRRITAVMSSVPTALVRITTTDRQSFVCTPGHPFLTPIGWIPAGKLPHGVSLHHAAENTRDNDVASALHSVREPFGHVVEESTRHVVEIQEGILHGCVREGGTPRGSVSTYGGNKPEVCLGADDGTQPHVPAGSPCESVGHAQIPWEYADNSRREWEADAGTSTSASRDAGVDMRRGDSAERRAIAVPLQARHHASIHESDSGSGWSVAHGPTASGPETRRTSGISRVVDVSILEPGSDGRYGGLCPDGLVYNIEVDTDHTYTVGTGIVVHNCHHGGAESWRGVLDYFQLNGRPFFCGFTATLRRDDGKALREIIDDVAYEKDLRWAIDEGYLVRPRGLTVKIPTLDMGKVKVRAGDYANNDLAEVMEAETSEVVKAIVNNASDRRAIIFAASVRAAWDIAVELDALGIRTGVITGSMTYDERQPVYEDFRSGETQMLVTVQVLTEGADFPMCDAVVIARPTRSQNLYSQMVGRALRLFEGKDDALVLDLVGASRVLGLVTLSNLDAGTTTRTVDPEGNELPPSDDDPPDDIPSGPALPRQKRLGPIETIGIDLLGGDHTETLWLETRKGVPFIPAGDRFVFLWREASHGHIDPLYRVGHMTSKGRAEGGWITERPWDAHTAKDIAEDWLIGQGIDPPLRRAAWRVGRSAPSDAQIRFARNLGIENPEQMDKGRTSDEINIALASRRLDGARTSETR